MTDHSRNNPEPRETHLLETDLWTSHNTLEHLTQSIQDLIHFKYGTNKDNGQLIECIAALAEVIGERTARAADVSDELIGRHFLTRQRLAEALTKIDKLQQELSNVTRAKEDCRSAFG